eukprot:4698225-Pyramimonas_sp.AAC.1
MLLGSSRRVRMRGGPQRKGAAAARLKSRALPARPVAATRAAPTPRIASAALILSLRFLMLLDLLQVVAGPRLDPRAAGAGMATASRATSFRALEAKE